MRISLIIISLIISASSTMVSHARGAKYGRFAETDPNYDYDSVRPSPPPAPTPAPSPAPAPIPDPPRPEPISPPPPPSNATLMQEQGGLVIAGFPEGCAYANINEPLPDHILGFGRIAFMGSSFAFQYRTSRSAAPFSITEVAQNVGVMGQNPDQGSPNLFATPADNFVIAQLLDRSELGLRPIVTCISPVLRGNITPDRPLIFGPDYYVEYRRFAAYRGNWRSKWDSWRTRWRAKEYDWRKPWRERDRNHWKDRDRDRDRRDPDKRPKPRPKPDREPGVVKPRPNPDKKPVVIRPMPIPDKKPVLVRPRPGRDRDRDTVFRPRPGDNRPGVQAPDNDEQRRRTRFRDADDDQAERRRGRR